LQNYSINLKFIFSIFSEKQLHHNIKRINLLYRTYEDVTTPDSPGKHMPDGSLFLLYRISKHSPVVVKILITGCTKDVKISQTKKPGAIISRFFLITYYFL